MDPFAWSQILALTAYPDDEHARNEFATVLDFQILVDLEGEDGYVELLADLAPYIGSLLMCRSLPQVAAEGHANTEAGVPCGSLFLFLLSAHAHHRDYRLSLSQAVRVVSDLLQRGTDSRVSERTLWRAWSRFRPVAHLQAWHLIQKKKLHDSPTPEEMMAQATLFAEDLPRYLAHAERLRLLAEQYGIVEKGELWSVPSDLELPEIDFQPTPLSDAEMQGLRSTRAPHGRES